MLRSFYENMSDPSAIIISIALMLFLGFAMTRLTKLLRLPNVTAYIITGIIIGPYCLDLIPEKIIVGTDFLSDIALAFISFSIGESFQFSTLKKSGGASVVITLFESLAASVAVFVLTFYILRMGMAFSIVLSALAAATAPASTLMTIRQTRAKGEFVDTLLHVIAMDDVVSLLAYSVAISVALMSISGSGGDFSVVAAPILANIFVLLLGSLFGFLLKLLMPRKRSTDNRLIISVGLLFAFCGICTLIDVSPLLGCMSMGMVYMNLTGDDKLFKQLNYFSPPILLLFFVRSGLNFKLDAFSRSSAMPGAVSLAAVGLLYFLVRIAGKYVGAFLGCRIVKKPKEVCNYLGLALVPQAGVAIGLAALCARTLGPGIGEDIQTIILASSVLYELVGPACAKLSLYLSGSYSKKLEDNVSECEKPPEAQKRPIDLLIEQLQQIQAQLPQRDEAAEDEQAFTQAAEEQYEMTHYAYRGQFLNRR